MEQRHGVLGCLPVSGRGTYIIRTTSTAGIFVRTSSCVVNVAGAHNQDDLDTVTLIEFEARMIPAASFAITDDDSYDTDSDEDGLLEDLDLRVVGQNIEREISSEIFTLDELVDSMQKGTWSCLRLCAGRIVGGERERVLEICACCSLESG